MTVAKGIALNLGGLLLAAAAFYGWPAAIGYVDDVTSRSEPVAEVVQTGYPKDGPLENRR